jgi:hypothetical protein
MSDDYETEYQEVARLQYEEIERLRALVKQREAELDVVVGWIAGEGDALTRLQAIYADPRSRVGDVIKASGLALPFERAKPASVAVVVDFKARVHDARQRTVELRKAEWARQGQLALESPATILGHDGGPETDPAA